MKRASQNIGIITIPISKAGNIPLSNLVEILYSLSENIHLITGNQRYKFFTGDKRIYTYGIEHKKGTNIFTRILRYIYMQLKISCKLAKITKNVDVWIFFIGGEGLVLPMLTAKLLGKTVVLASAGSGFKVAQAQKDPLTKALSLLQNITYRLADRIVMYSERLIDVHSLQKYRCKISIAHEHFLDLNKFKIKNTFNNRRNTIGYIGALSKAKGVLHLLHAISKILISENEIDFLIGGDGELRSKVEEFSNLKRLNGKITFSGWIPHDELPPYLNNLKLLILPSYTEGLPNIILEAMACGTPVLATPVGTISDVIKDEETGFIMKNNSPECIAKNIIRVLECPYLEKIVENARELVENEFTYEKAVEKWREIFEWI